MHLKDKSNFKVPSGRFFSYPIAGLLISTILLFIIVGILTWANYKRESHLLESSLERQGVTVISAMKAGFRSGMERMWQRNQLNLLFKETAKGPNIDRILLVDKNGTVINDSKNSGRNWYDNYFSTPETQNSLTTLIYKNLTGDNIFRLISSFNFNENRINQYNFRDSNEMGAECSSSTGTGRGILGGNYFIVLDLKMFEYQEAQAEDIRFTILYGLILLIVGSASFYFLLLAQNYYVTNHTLKTMESYTQNILESMPNGLISLDTEGKIESINHNALQLLKLDSEKIKGQKIDAVLQNCRLPEPSLLDNNILQKQIECRLNDNSIIPLNITVSKLNNGLGKEIGLVIILSDLRDIRSLEKQILRSERLASLGRMAAGIAHEIRNPLSSIKGFVQYFRNKFPDNSRDRAYASVVVSEVDRLNRVIQDMLNFAKPKEPKLEKIILQDLIDHSLKLIQPDIRGNKIKVTTEYLKINPVNIFGDFDMLTQVFLNLLLNAVDAMETDGQLSISIIQKPGIVDIIITDNGKGIPSENISKIFDPFYTSKKEGTGLGLAIVYSIIESHGGEISAESIPGSTTFRITFKTGR